MTHPLWIDKYEPSLEDLKQDDTREVLTSATDGRMNVLVHGPEGVGKTAAVNALLDETHTNTDQSVIYVNADQFFSLSKKELREHDRYGRFIDAKTQRNLSKAQLFTHVIKELTAYHPLEESEFQTLVIDNAGGMREDFQHALRRTIETHAKTTQFILISRSISTIIPALQSRCLPISMPALEDDNVVDILTDILEKEEADEDNYTAGGVRAIVSLANGNTRFAITLTQAVLTQEDEITVETVTEVYEKTGSIAEIESLLDNIRGGDIVEARSEIIDLLIDEGLSGEQILSQLYITISDNYDKETVQDLSPLFSTIDLNIQQADNEHVQLTKLAGQLSQQIG